MDPTKIAETIEIPIQGGLDPKYLLLDRDDMLNNARKYLEIFGFNLHQVMQEVP